MASMETRGFRQIDHLNRITTLTACVVACFDLVILAQGDEGREDDVNQQKR